jgi:hypothetical protein
MTQELQNQQIAILVTYVCVGEHGVPAARRAMNVLVFRPLELRA